jgi:hypothetical protein
LGEDVDLARHDLGRDAHARVAHGDEDRCALVSARRPPASADLACPKPRRLDVSSFHVGGATLLELPQARRAPASSRGKWMPRGHCGRPTPSPARPSRGPRRFPRPGARSWPAGSVRRCEISVCCLGVGMAPACELTKAPRLRTWGEARPGAGP